MSLIVICLATLSCFCVSCYYSYFYPLDYKEVIISNANAYQLEPELVASIINVESSYNVDSISNKGAVGLMQILPSTAEWSCDRIGIEYNERELYDPEINIKIGTYYLAYLLDYFKDESLAICAYNAGMGNVKKWLSSIEFSSDGQSLNNIPFKETENYLKQVQKNKQIYKNKF